MDSSLDAILTAKNNAEDIKKFLSEMSSWEKEIKEKECIMKGESPVNKDIPLPRNARKQKKASSASSKSEKSKMPCDYAAWDKFDVEKACSKVDAETDSASGEENEHPGNTGTTSKDQQDLVLHAKPQVTLNSPKPNNVTDNVDNAEKLQNMDAAHFEKELGNKFVKEEKWHEAIECYSKAIEFDPENAIFHANRALCYLKIGNFKVAEVDSTIAIQLDNSYFKAYHRRALALKGLQQYKEAVVDFKQVLKLNPNNVAARSEITKIEEYLAKVDEKSSKPPATPIFNVKRAFGAEESRKKLKRENLPTNTAPEKKARDVVKQPQLLDVFTPLLPPGSVPVVPIVKPPHLRSKEPLTRVEIKQVGDKSCFERLVDKLHKPQSVPEPSTTSTIKQPSCTVATTDSQKVEEQSAVNITLPGVPKTYLQFETGWRTVCNDSSLSYQYLKSIPYGSLRSVMGSTLESEMLSSLLHVLAQISPMDSVFVLEFLKALSTVERFRSLVMFMSSQDQTDVETCIKNFNSIDKDDIQEIRTLFDL